MPSKNEILFHKIGEEPQNLNDSTILNGIVHFDLYDCPNCSSRCTYE